MIKKSLIIKIACFLSAFAAVVAGFLLREFMINKAVHDRAYAMDKMTLSEFAESIENMTFLLSNKNAISGESNASLCAEIMLDASLARSALGFSQIDCPALFSFLKSVSEISETFIETDMDKEILSLFHAYSERICDDALPHLLDDKNRFETVISEIFSDTSLETLLYEKGYDALVKTEGFESLGSCNSIISEKETIKLAKKYLGKNAYLSAELSEGEHPFFHVTGKNISALISAGNGALIQLLFDLPEGKTSITEVEAETNAKEFLSDAGITDDTLVKLSAENEAGLYLFEYSPIRNGVLCISESILVGVSAESGRICLFDAVDFYRYKTKKVILPDEILTEEDIMNRFSLSYVPELCKIERKKGIESICYRVKDGDQYRFINAVTAEIIK